MTDAQVTEMRDRHELDGLGAAAIAREMRLALGTVRKIIYYQRRVTRVERWRDAEV